MKPLCPRLQAADVVGVGAAAVRTRYARQRAAAGQARGLHVLALERAGRGRECTLGTRWHDATIRIDVAAGATRIGHGNLARSAPTPAVCASAGRIDTTAPAVIAPTASTRRRDGTPVVGLRGCDRILVEFDVVHDTPARPQPFHNPEALTTSPYRRLGERAGVGRLRTPFVSAVGKSTAPTDDTGLHRAAVWRCAWTSIPSQETAMLSGFGLRTFWAIVVVVIAAVAVFALTPRRAGRDRRACRRNRSRAGGGRHRGRDACHG